MQTNSITKHPSHSLDSILFFFFGVVGFSQVSSDIIIGIFKLPISLPELFYLPMLFYLRRFFLFKNLLSLPFYLTICFLLILFLVGALCSNTSLFGYISSLRIYILVVFFFFLAYKNDALQPKFIFLLSYGALVGSVFRAVFEFYTRLSANRTEEYAVASSVLAIAYSISYSLQQKNIYFKITTLLLALLGAFFMVSRGQALLSILAITISLTLIVLKNKVKEICTVSVVIAFCGLFVLAYNNFEETIQEAAPSVHFRLYTKTKSIVEGETSEADNTRKSNFGNMLLRFENLSYPLGLRSKEKSQDTPFSILQYRDMPILELMDMFSPVGFLLLFLVVASRVRRVVGLYFSSINDEALPSIVVFCVFVYSLFFGFGVLMDPYSVGFLGIVSGRLFYISTKC